MESEIKYLIKFVQKREHAEFLSKGKLYMRTANYYRTDFESPARDIFEGSLSHKQMLFKGTNHYIFCLYCVTKKMLDTNETIGRQMIEHFNCFDGYAVIIEYKPFSEMLSNAKDNRYRLVGNKVIYGAIIDNKVTIALFMDDNNKNLFIKPPSFKIENEYRLVSGKTSSNDNKPYVLNIGKSLKECSRIIKISSLFKENELIHLKELMENNR